MRQPTRDTGFATGAVCGTPVTLPAGLIQGVTEEFVGMAMLCLFLVLDSFAVLCDEMERR